MVINKLGGNIDKMDQNAEDKKSIWKYKIKNYYLLQKLFYFFRK